MAGPSRSLKDESLMANHKFQPPPDVKKSPHMEERDPTAEELAAVAGIDLPPLTAPIDPSRDEDYEEDDRPAAQASSGPRSLSDVEVRAQAMLDEMKAKESAGAPPDMQTQAMLMLAQALQGLQQATRDGHQTQADMQRRVQAPENRFFPNISVFNLRGDKDFKRPSLRCEMLIPWKVEEESMTREELELLNLLEEGPHWFAGNDGRRVTVTVTMQRKLGSDEPNLIAITHDTAFNQENHKNIPFNWLRQLVEHNPLTKQAARAVLTMDDEETLILARQYNDGRQAAGRDSVVSVGA